METYMIAALTLLCLILLLLLLRKSRRPSSDAGLIRMGQKLEQLDRMARQVDEMNRVFRSPRLRGGLGEVLLENLIRNRLPRGSYDFQHSFSGGQRADAVIRMGSYKVAVDAKFPLEQMEAFYAGDGEKEIPKSIRKIFLDHGKSIAEKYILPREGTLSFALMYIPAEDLYYRVFIAGGGSLNEELQALGIVPVSPSTLFTYLQTVSYGFKGFRFSSRSREIMQAIAQLKTEYDLFLRQYQLAQSHLKNFQKAWEDSGSRLEGLDRSMSRLQDES